MTSKKSKPDNTDLAPLLDYLRDEVLHCHQVMFRVFESLRAARLSSVDWWSAVNAMAKVEILIEKEIDKHHG